MQVQSINNSTNNIAFGQKRFIDNKTYQYLTDILPKMHKQTVYIANDTDYKRSFLKELQVGKFKLIDGRVFTEKIPEKEQFPEETLIEYGSTQLVINNKNGEVIDYNKPIFTTWKKILKTVSEKIKFISENFENKDLVKRRRSESSGRTEEGHIKQKELENKFRQLESEFV